MKPPERDEPLCCCEYLDRTGERSHLVASLCNCEDLDECCERRLTCRPLPPGNLERIIATFTDRFRFPWLGGAVRIDTSLLPPVILLPVFLHVAALHLLLALIILITLPVLVLWYYYLTHRTKGRTLFFLSLGLFSLGYMYFVFLQEVVPRGRVGRSQVAILTCGLLLMLLALSRAKRDPGYLTCQMRSSKPFCHGNNTDIVISSSSGQGNASSLSRAALAGIAMSGHTEDSARLLKEEPNGVTKDWCPTCRLVRPPRAGHCRICGQCVKRLDHHCVWINSCVGERNHQAFVLVLSLFMLTSLYGISLTLDTVCRGKAALKALFYCPGVYADYRRFVLSCGEHPQWRSSRRSRSDLLGCCVSSGAPLDAQHPRRSEQLRRLLRYSMHSSQEALSFTCVWYCVIVTSGMGYILLIQLLNISYNVTEREARIALRESSGRRLFCGMVVDTGQYSRGFLRNWIQFLTLGSPALQHSTGVMV